MVTAQEKGCNALNALVQCTPGLSQTSCSDCLLSAFGQIPLCCDGKQGGRVIAPSCNFRYEEYPFFGPVADIAPPSTNTSAAKGTFPE